MRAAIVLSLAGLLLLVCAAAASSPDSAVDHGKEVYAIQKCSLCHAIAGIGGTKHALDSVGSKLSSEDIKKWIRTPKQMKAGTIMKPYPNLPERDLNDLTAFLLTLK